MSEIKISQLPAATVPLDGTETLPIVQSGTTRKVSTADITAGRAVTAASITATGAISGDSVTATNAVSGATLSVSGAVTFTSGLNVANGGTGVATLTGIVKGSGTSAFSAAVRGTDYSLISRATEIATTSGTTADFTGLPAGIRRITMMLNGVSFATSGDLRFQLGTSSGIDASGYKVSGGYYGLTQDANGSLTASGFDAFYGSSALTIWNGQVTFFNVSGNIWVADGSFFDENNLRYLEKVVGVKTLASTLDRVRLTSTTGATFDAGSINILYEF